MKKCIFREVCTALITPIKDGEVDYDSLRTLIERQLNAKVDAIAVLGTTGEPFTLTDEEKTKIVRLARSLTIGKTKLIIGTHSSGTSNVISECMWAQKEGADGLLITPPAFVKASDNGIIAHFKSICEHTELPIIVANNPSRTGVNLKPAVVKELADISNIVGIKECNDDIDHILNLFQELDDSLAVYCGNDRLNYIFLAQGAMGMISVASNVYPKKLKSLCKEVNEKQFNRALKIQEKMYKFNKALYLEANPIPVKSALAFMGLCSDEMRLPLTKLNVENKKILKNELLPPDKEYD